MVAGRPEGLEDRVRVAAAGCCRRDNHHGVSALQLGTVSDTFASVLFVPALLAAATLYGKAIQRDRAAQQRSRESAVLSRLPALRSGSEPYYLYLRPFASTGGVRVLRRVAKRKRSLATYGSDPRFNPGAGFIYKLEVVWNDLETLLEAAVRPKGPLVALGRPGEQLGAARIASDEEDWKGLVEDLVHHAVLVFVLPSQDAGTAWELSLITANPALLRKTVFVIPGSPNEQDWIGARSDPRTLSGSVLTYSSERPDRGARPTSSADPSRVPELQRPGQVLRRDALACLRQLGAHDAVQLAIDQPTVTLTMLTDQFATKEFHAVTGYVTSLSLNIADKGPIYRLDIAAFKQAVATLENHTLSV
jgi:hypothetical protein